MTTCSPTDRPDHKRGGRRRAFTLIEMSVSLAIMSILIVAMGSTIMLASSALPGGDSPAECVIDASQGAERLAEELRTAVHMTERAAHAVTFTVADRDDDGIWECIRYAWDGTAGSPVTRQYNNGAPTTVIDNVHQFDLSYDLKAVVEEYPGPPVIESDEIVLSEHQIITNSDEVSIDDSNWVGQYFKPILPEDALSWSVTRLFVAAIPHGPIDGTTLVQLRPADASARPTLDVLEQHAMNEVDLLPYYTWREFAFGNVAGLSPAAGLCLVFEWQSSTHSADILCDKGDGPGYLKTTNAGAGWTFKVNEAMLHFIVGKVVVPGYMQTATRQYVTAVGATIRAGDNVASRIETTIQTLNAPEALTAVWEADLNADPTLIDINGDTIADWRVDNGATFNMDQLEEGIFFPTMALNTNPACNFGELTTVDVRLADMLDDGQAGAIRLRVDRTGYTYGYIEAEILKVADGTQTLTVSTYDRHLNYAAVVTETELPEDEFVDLRLLVDPALDTVNIQINGVQQGTHQYGRITAVTPHVIELFETAPYSGAEFDYVRVRLGGN